MAANYLGLFDPMQGDPRQAEIEARRQREMQLAQLAPAQQVAAARMMGAGNAGQGAGQLASGLFGMLPGVDTRDPQAKMEAVRKRVQAALQGADMTDPDKVYPVLIRELQAAGMVSQAMQAVKEYEDMKGKAEDRATRKQTADTKAASAAATAEFLRAKAAALQSSPKERILADYAATLGKLEAGEYKDEAEKAALQRLLIAQERTLGVKPEKVGGTWKVTVQQGTATDPARIIKYDTVTGKVETTTLDGKPIGDIAAEQAAKAKGNKPLGAKDMGELSDVADQLSTLVRLSNSYRPDFSLAPGMERFLGKLASAAGYSDKAQLLQRLFGKNQDAAAWWSAYANLMTHVRHALFGATLTGGESAAFDLIKGLLALPPQATVDKLKEQATSGLAGAQAKVRTFGGEYGVGDLPQRFEALAAPIQALQGKSVGTAPAGPVAAPAAPAAPAAQQPKVVNW